MNDDNIVNEKKVEHKLKYWISQLFDFSRRNQLLYFKESNT